MGCICFFTISKGGLLQLSNIFRNTKPLGTEFNIIYCPINGLFILLDINRDMELMNNTNYHWDIGVVSACTNRMIKATKGLFHGKNCF